MTQHQNIETPDPILSWALSLTGSIDSVYKKTKTRTTQCVAEGHEAVREQQTPPCSALFPD
jgi:hypothetical protein